MANNLQEWLSQGEQLYASALNQFQNLEAQLDALEEALLAKQAEVNQIAQVIGKPPVDGSRRLTAELLAAEPVAIEHAPQPSSTASIARALSGKFGR